MSNIYKSVLLGIGMLLNNFTIGQTVRDIDGHVYSTVTIGSQTWLQQNLKTIHYRNGDSIPTVTGPVNNDSSASYQWAYNNDTAYVNNYGRLYTWFAANDIRGLCPIGWHVPSQSEWDTLISFLGGEFTAGNLAKDTGTRFWINTSSAVNNASGFSARGSGRRGNPQGFSRIKEVTSFWSSTAIGSSGFPRGGHYTLMANGAFFQKGVAVSNYGTCVRCLRDQSVGMNSLTEESIRIAPNPSSGRFEIQLNKDFLYQITIVNFSGQVVYQQNKSRPGNLEIILNQPAGIYHLVVVSQQAKVIRKLVIQ